MAVGTHTAMCVADGASLIELIRATNELAISTLIISSSEQVSWGVQWIHP